MRRPARVGRRGRGGRTRWAGRKGGPGCAGRGGALASAAPTPPRPRAPPLSRRPAPPRVRGPVRALALAVLALAAAGAQAQITVRGFVETAEGTPLPGANVAVRALAGGPLQGATADGDGFYEVGPLAPGRYAVRVSFVGYVAYADTVRLTDGPVFPLTVALRSAEDALDEVVVEGTGGAVTVDGVQTIGPRDIARVPTPGGSGDLAGYLTTLPSVVTTGDTGGQLYVRGGTPSQNLVLVDGAPVFQPFHAVGFFSAFPEDVVGSVDLYAGGFGVRYNGRVSSVLDVTTRVGNLEAFEAAAEASPFLVGGRVEGPIRRGGSSFLVSARRSVIGATAPTVLGRDVPLAFSDVHAKVAQRDETGTCSASVLYTTDEGRVDPERGDIFGWTNGVVGGHCLFAPVTTAVRFETNLSLSYIGNRAGLADDPERTSSVYLLNADVDLSRLTSFGRLRYGAYGRLIRSAFTLGEQFATVRADDETAVTTGAYAEAEVALGGGLRATGGVLMSVPPYRSGPTVEPRGRLAWRPAGDSGPSLDLAAGLYRQSLLGITDERDAGSPFTAWSRPPVGDEETVARHLLLGASLPLGGLRLGAEVYDKRMRSQPVPEWSAVARFTTNLALADVVARGAEVRAEGRRGGAYGFVGYGYAEVEYTAQTDFGAWFGDPILAYNPPHDRRHQLSALGSYARGPWTASARWQYGSGLPFTRVAGFDEAIPPVGLPDVTGQRGTPRVLFDRPYNGRLPEYHRLDLSVGYRRPLAAGALDVQGGVINAYDRANLFYFDVFRLKRVDQLPIVPYVSVKVELGGTARAGR